MALPGEDAFAGSGAAGPNTAAGRSGNRTGLTDVYTPRGGTTAVTTTTGYQYDWADRLLSSTVTNAAPGADSIADGLAASDIAYDVAGNTTRLGTVALAYDAAGLHSGSTYADGTTVVVLRDAGGRVVSRTVDPLGLSGGDPATTVTYLYSGADDVPFATKTGTSLTRTIGLPGGVSVTLGATATWQYPNLLGHTLVSGNGTNHGAMQVYDPFGQALDMATYAIGTVAANRAGQSNGATGWHQDARKGTETESTILMIEMGARLYVPALGRFLQVDPVEGGVDNDYVWPTDPIGTADLSGEFVPLVLVGILAVLGSPIFLIGATVAVGAIVVATNPWVRSAVAGAVQALRNFPTYLAAATFTVAAGIMAMAHRKKTPAINSDRVGHRKGNNPQKHEDANGYGGRQKPNTPPNPNKRPKPEMRVQGGGTGISFGRTLVIAA